MLFSVIVPMYNVQKYAEMCIESILRQTYEEFELIIVNDGSKDQTPEIIKRYAKNDGRIIVINKDNGGITSARKAGVKRAIGDYIISVDGDDWIEPNALEMVEKVIREENPDVVFFGHYSVKSGFVKQIHRVVTQQECLDQARIHQELIPCFFGGNGKYRDIPNLWNKAFRRDRYEKYCSMLDDRIVMGEDGAIAYPCIFEAKRICLLSEILYNYRLSPDSLTRSKQKYLEWDTAELRVEHYIKVFACVPEMKNHIARFATHAYFNVILSHLKHENYKKVRKESLEKLAGSDLSELLRINKTNTAMKQRLANFALRYKQIWLIKLYSMIA